MSRELAGMWALVRVVQLSDHPGGQLQQARRHRAAQQEQDRLRYEAVLAQHELRVGAARRELDRARAGHRWWAGLRAAFAVWRERRRLPAAPAVMVRVPDREASLGAGVEGEQRVAAGLGRVLGDEWTLIRGYCNRRGEIDQLLLGPWGLIAIEVKNRSVTVGCDGDQWWFTRYDRYGNQVDRGVLADRRGRSPSVQLNEPADQLEGFLRSRGHPVPIQRMVLFPHPRARLGRCTNLTVHVATGTSYVIDLIKGSPPGITADKQAEIERLICRDHKYHERNRLR